MPLHQAHRPSPRGPLRASLQLRLRALRDLLRRAPRRHLYPGLGFLFALGAPLGLLVTRAYEDDVSHVAHLGPHGALGWLVDELVADSNAYVFLIFFSTTLLMGLGVLLGHQEDRLRLLATTDPLTGLMNRRTFSQRLHQELARAKRYKTALSLLIIDLDWLKAINDVHGHSAGDKAIDAVADTLRRGLRATDLAARYAGDEFVALLPETTAREALGLARRLGAQVATIALGPQGASLSVSIGVADLEGAESLTTEGLFVAADEALYRAKAAGRNNVVVAEGAPTALM